jgi:hypothetical protein
MLVSLMFGLFGMIGRSKELQVLDQALRVVSLHPRFVPEAIKLTIIKLLTKANLEPRPYDAAAEILGYCILGAQGFTESNDLGLTEAVEARLLAALEDGVSLDAAIVLLTLHAGVIQMSVVERFGLEVS